MKHEPFKYTVCSICGKKFIKSAASIYHVNFAGRTNQCCSYKCYEKAKQIKSENNSHEYMMYLKELKLNENKASN